jgi:hypothetical protein
VETSGQTFQTMGQNTAITVLLTTEFLSTPINILRTTVTMEGVAVTLGVELTHGTMAPVAILAAVGI